MIGKSDIGQPEGASCAFRLPVVFGILNVTRDSFSDGGRFLTASDAIAHARELVRAGAHVVDVGAAASNPRAESVSPDEEIARLEPVVQSLKHGGVPVSIDTFAPQVQRWALAQGVEYLNDIHGFGESELYPVLADSAARLVVMHAVQKQGRATAVDVPSEKTFAGIIDFFDARLSTLERAGVKRSRMILDPGMGFFLSSRPEASFDVLRRLPELKAAFGLPVLVSVSRKSFLRRTARRAAGEAGHATLAGEIFAVFRGADYIRTHDPAALADGLAVWTAALTGNTTSS